MKLIKLNKKVILTVLSLMTCIGLVACNEKPKEESQAGNAMENTFQNAAPVVQVEEPEEEMVVVNVGNFGRANPFSPYSERDLTLDGSIDSAFIKDLAPPPPTFAENPELSQMLGAKVTGVLYDGARSSAIININGQDQLARVGDKIDNFIISNISRNTITLKNGYNTYDVSVGELIYSNIDARTNFTDKIYSLNSKFGGNKKVRGMGSLNLKPPVNNEIEIKTSNIDNL